MPTSTRQPSELVVVTKAKELCQYVMTITEGSPKRFRFTFVSRMQNLALDIIECLFRANATFIGAGSVEADWRERRDLQHRALTSAQLLAYVAMLACEQKCIAPKHFEQISDRTATCQRMIGGWINSDTKRRSPSDAAGYGQGALR
ncbi:MAG: four helix bundle protein [Micrococcales bacterium]|nr:four helix bundle protein [Micrococcales bacterium]